MIVLGAATMYGLYNEYQHSKNEVAYVVRFFFIIRVNNEFVNRILLKTTCLRAK